MPPLPYGRGGYCYTIGLRSEGSSSCRLAVYELPGHQRFSLVAEFNWIWELDVKTVLDFLALILALCFFASLIMLLMKTRRKRGLRLMGYSFVAILALSMVMHDEKPNPDIAKPVSQKQEAPSVLSAADVGNFPDETTKKKAKTLGLERYAALKLITDEKAIARFCRYEDQSYQLAREVERLVNNGTEWNDANAQIEPKQVALLEAANADLGLVDYELSTLSIGGHWNHYCRASELGWAVVNETNAEAVKKG